MTAYRTGDGTLANVALDRALTRAYPLAHLPAIEAIGQRRPTQRSVGMQVPRFPWIAVGGFDVPGQDAALALADRSDRQQDLPHLLDVPDTAPGDLPAHGDDHGHDPVPPPALMGRHSRGHRRGGLPVGAVVQSPCPVTDVPFVTVIHGPSRSSAVTHRLVVTRFRGDRVISTPRPWLNT